MFFHLFGSNGWTFSVYVIGVKSSHVRPLTMSGHRVNRTKKHSHTHTLTHPHTFTLTTSFSVPLLRAGVYSLFYAIEHPCFALLRFVFMFMFNCTVRLQLFIVIAAIYEFFYTQYVWVQTMITRANNNVNDWVRIIETIRLFYSGMAWNNCLARIYNNFSIFALVVFNFGFGTQHNYMNRARNKSDLLPSQTSTTNSDDPCIWQQSAALLVFI